MSDETSPKGKEVRTPLDNEDVLALLESSKASEPGDLRLGENLRVGDATNPLTPQVGGITSAGYVTVYNRLTGDPSIINRNNLPTVLRKQKEGQYVFTLKDPGFRPKQGVLRCFLHKEDVLREKWDSFGLPTCSKANLQTQYDRKRHMSRRHPSEWSIMEDDRRTIEDVEWKAQQKEDREFQRKLMERLVIIQEAATPPTKEIVNGDRED